MGWTVILKEGSKEILKKELNIDDDSILHTGKFKVLNKLDPYSDATISRYVLNDLIADLKELKKAVPQISADLIAVCDMVEMMKGKEAITMKFYGD